MTVQMLIDHLSFRYAKRGGWIVNDISLKIYQGEFIGIIGPNGGGKTTLTQLMLGLLKPTLGTIQTLSQGNLSPGIGWVPQHFSFDFSFPISVQEVALLGRLSTLSWHGKYKEADYLAVEEALKTVDLWHHRHSCFSHLSGGQIQRVLLARALASDPQLLILDEPTANIDPENQQHILKILTALNRNCTIIMITHDLHHAINHFSKVLYMNKTLTTLSDTMDIPERFCCPSDEKRVRL
ncbi:ABC transporter family protein [Chlamydia ibidis]|uniref:ABC transporter family protein n=2 Tax=Chlamydia ibidis TaxID=1405396 RepID=S7KGX1_9CHLA|nr:metal ABC transporter ATP-binding protein [Chlamydia ibidis]EPP35421.1 ABC transporter family protein [Chlamydia ibidis]EQM62970.1 ABC transporter family protein [Chlamydia ibidis 10-1398/6]